MKLKQVHIQNFKAIVDSKSVKLGDLTVFIGNNGVGKSSLIEALETYQQLCYWGLDTAMQRWHGLEHLLHKRTVAAHAQKKLAFTLQVESKKTAKSVLKTNKFKHELVVTTDSSSSNRYFIDRDCVNDLDLRGDAVRSECPGLMNNEQFKDLSDYIASWQFLRMHAESMGEPTPQSRTGGGVRLADNGSNIADYLRDIREQSMAAYESIVETMAYVLPYAKDIQPSVSSEIERKSYLQLSEKDFKVPGWMLSTGTLRVLALLALLRHPNPPPLLVIEELENGLDPRSIHLLVEEIRDAVQAGTTQVIITTHSPYLLDLLKLEHLVLVTRNDKGEPQFKRPAQSEQLSKWVETFAPGKLYTMGALQEEAL